MPRPSTHTVGLDIGQTKVCVLIAEPRDAGAIDIVGFGSAPSRGMRKGVVVNLDACVSSIKQAVEEAELMAGCSVDRAFVGVAGAHVRGLNSRGVVAISGRDHEVTRDDVQRVLAAARAVNIPPEREIFHVLPQEFMVDDQDGIHDPAGMTGSKLQANVHIVTASVTAAQNLVNSVNRAGVEVEEVVLEQLAAADAVLTPDEREMGVALIDIGAGTTDLVIFERGAIRHIAALPTGGGSMLEGIQEAAEQSLHLPVRRGAPGGLGGLADSVATPQHSTVVGLALFGARRRERLPQKTVHPFLLARVGDMVRGWLSE